MTNREKLIEVLRVLIFHHELVDPTEALADYLLDNGVVVREKGEWERVIPTKSAAKWSNKVACSVCHRGAYVRYNFCPNCGADMRKRENG